jgi:HK97 family phage major capsid protein
MPYNSQIERTDAAVLIPEEVQREIVQTVPEASSFLSLARRLPNMSAKVSKIPILETLPLAHFVTGDTGLKQTTTMKWKNKTITAEELAVIVPVPEAVLDDSNYDIWGEIRPKIVEAIGVAIDQAVFHGTNKPASWPTDIVTAATAAGNVVALGTGEDLFDDVFGESGLLAKVEADGFMPNGHVAAMTMKAKYRGLRDANGQPIFLRSMQETTRYELDGERILFPRNGAIDSSAALQLSGDFSELVYSIRQDVTAKVFDQGVVQDAQGAIVFNLMQQDMVALRVVIRLGWEVPNPINRLQQVEANRYPIAVLTPGP